MKNTQTTLLTLLLTGILWLLSLPAVSAEPPQSEMANRVVALVDKAAALVEANGQAAFPEFRKKNSEWYNDDLYVFVDGMDGTSIVNPPSPEIEGRNLIDSKDAEGKAFLRAFIETVTKQGSGWVDYWWPKPGHDKPSKKISYIKQATTPGGLTVIVGAGLYID